MNLLYWAKKTLKIFIYFFNNKIGYHSNFKGNIRCNKILFDFSDKDSMHLGDSLFFLPSVRWLEENGITVYISAHNAVKELYKCYGIDIDSSSFDVSRIDLTVTNWESKSLLNFNTSPVIWFNCTDARISEPIGLFILKNICAIANISVPPRNWNCWRVKIFRTKNFNQKYVIYSEEVDSGKFRVTKKMKLELLSKAVEFSKRNNCILILVGLIPSNKERTKAMVIDLRGKTSLDDLFKILSNKKCLKVFSFDTAIAHIAFSLNKNCYVMLKKRILKKNSLYIRKFLFPIMPSPNKA